MQKFEEIKTKFKEIEHQLHDPSLVLDHQKLKVLNKEYQQMMPVYHKILEQEELNKAKNEAEKTFEETEDPELKKLAAEEVQTIRESLIKTEDELKQFFLQTNPEDDKNAIVEIRAGAGGDEASLFAAELFRMYSRYAENKGWKSQLISESKIGLGGFKEVIFEVRGSGAFGHLKYESGVHRVQRVPETEKSGRIHTSTVTVAVLQEVQELDMQIDPKELKIEPTTSSGHGGQSVNTTYSAIRITHLPTGLTVHCQDERSQKQNKERAMSIIRSRVFALREEERRKERSEARKGQIGTGDRSEKIRTYNFPQDRVTDHRIKLTVHNIVGVLDGKLDPLIDRIKEVAQTGETKN